jgi:hypothetical protein
MRLVRPRHKHLKNRQLLTIGAILTDAFATMAGGGAKFLHFFSRKPS